MKKVIRADRVGKVRFVKILLKKHLNYLYRSTVDNVSLSKQTETITVKVTVRNPILIHRMKESDFLNNFQSTN